MKTLLPVAIACLAVAGCGSSDKKSPDSTGASAPPASQGASDGGGPAVSMKDLKFKPETVTVKAGQPIKWTNDDPVEHTVTYESGPAKKFDSGTVASGDTYEQTFTKPGTIKYLCTIHPGQKGTIIVE